MLVITGAGVQGLWGVDFKIAKKTFKRGDDFKPFFNLYSNLLEFVLTKHKLNSIILDKFFDNLTREISSAEGTHYRRFGIYWASCC